MGTVILFLLILWLLGIAGTMIRYGNFTIEKRQNELFIKRGLLETKELTIPYHRIQAIGVEQSIIRQPFGYVRLFAVVAGGSFDQLETFPVLFPLMRREEIADFLRTFLPEYAGFSDVTLQPLPKRSLFFYLSKTVLLPLILLIVSVIYFMKFIWIPIILVIISLFFGYMRFKDVGYHLREQFFTLQFRRFQKTLIMTQKNRIQSITKSKHRLQAWSKIASIHLSLIGSFGLGTHYVLRHLDYENALSIATWFSYRKQEHK